MIYETIKVVEFINGWKVEIHNENRLGQFYCATKNGVCRTSQDITYLRRSLVRKSPFVERLP